MRSSRELFKVVGPSLKEVFSSKYYLVLAIILSLTAFSASLWITNLKLIVTVIISPLFSVLDKAFLMFSLLGGITTNVDFLGAVLLIIMSILFGVNAALLIYSMTRTDKMVIGTQSANGVATLSAIISALVGVGCVSCGTYLLGAALASVGASGLIVFLPLAGREFLLLSIILLSISIVWVSKGIQAKKVCI